LRLALEEVSGLDLNWYFDQWYYSAGHPELNVSYHWDSATSTQTVYVRQTQTARLFSLPVAIDIYTGKKKTRYPVWIKDRSDTLVFHLASKPDLVNFDGDKVLLAKITDNKTPDELAFQYFNCPLYLDRLEAIDTARANQTNDAAQKILIAALRDKYYGLRIAAIHALDLKIESNLAAATPVLTDLAQTDPNTLARAAAILALGKLNRPEDRPIFDKALTSPSPAVQAAALTAIKARDKPDLTPTHTAGMGN
jgi:aminopeptidase N